MARRSKAREVAVQMLYQQDLNSAIEIVDVRSMVDDQIADPDLRDFAWSLYVSVMESRLAIDARIEQVAENWTLSRMAPIDRNILRLGAWELASSETPYQVVIDEAVELAKKFGSAQSHQFVNGLLDRLVPDSKRN